MNNEQLSGLSIACIEKVKLTLDLTRSLDPSVDLPSSRAQISEREGWGQIPKPEMRSEGLCRVRMLSVDSKITIILRIIRELDCSQSPIFS